MPSFRVAILIAIATLAPATSSANPEYSRRTGKDCNYCHPANTFRLSDAGKYYKLHKSLKGFVPPPSAPVPNPPKK